MFLFRLISRSVHSRSCFLDPCNSLAVRGGYRCDRVFCSVFVVPPDRNTESPARNADAAGDDLFPFYFRLSFVSFCSSTTHKTPKEEARFVLVDLSLLLVSYFQCQRNNNNNTNKMESHLQRRNTAISQLGK